MKEAPTFSQGEERLLIDPEQGTRNPVVLAFLSMIVGAFTGLIGAMFRVCLQKADVLRSTIIERAHLWGWSGILLVIAIPAVAAGLAAWLVRQFSPESTGSGIPHVEKQLRQGWSGNPLRIVLVKFFGGILAIGSGLALGREGPSVQTGAGIGQLIGDAFRRNENERRVLLAAGAGAGLATAFNAPIAGAVFVLEELVGRFDGPVTIATLGASAGAIAVARVLLGVAPDFQIDAFKNPGFGTVPANLALGVMFGFLGVAYNRFLLKGLDFSAKMRKIPVSWRASIIGALIGLLGWFAPKIIGGGDLLTEQALRGNVLLRDLLLLLAIRFVLGPVSYAARTPGGLFAPMLTIGSQGGLLFGAIWSRLFVSNTTLPREFAVVGMAAFFAAVVRAPITGIILAIELTGCFTLMLPMLGAAFAAMTVATILNEPPIYDSLRTRS